jgi:hypothetical protein
MAEISQFSRVHAAVDKDSARELRRGTMYKEIVIFQDQKLMEPTTARAIKWEQSQSAF